MSPEDFGYALAHLELTQVRFARLIDVNDRTVRGWASGEIPIPRLVELFLDLGRYKPTAFAELIRAQELEDDAL